MTMEPDIPSFPFIKVHDGGCDVVLVTDPGHGYRLGVGWSVECRAADGSPGAVGDRLRRPVAWYPVEREQCGPGLVAMGTAAGVPRVHVPGRGVPDAAA